MSALGRQNFISLISSSRLLLICLAFFLGLALFFLGLEIANAHRIVWGVKVADLNLGGLKPEQARTVLEESLNQFRANDLMLKYQNQNWLTNLGTLGLEPQIDQTLDQAFQIGRQKNILIGLNQQIRALFGQYHLPLSFKIDQNRFQSFIATQLNSLEKPVQDASLVYNPQKDDFEIIPAKEGLVINQKQLREDLSQRISYLSLQPIELSLTEKKPKISHHQAEKTRQKVLAILKAAPYHLNSQNKTWSIDKETIIDWLSFQAKDNILEIVLDQDKIEAYLTTLAPNINQPAVNARLAAKSQGPSVAESAFEQSERLPQNDNVVVLTPSQNKTELRIKESAALINDLILNAQKEIQLLVNLSPAQVTAQNINQLGLTALLGQGVSNFAGSSANRIHNIKIGAAKFDGFLLEPNQELSFNEILGEIGPQQGYLEELVIKKDKTIPEYGGGLCQVSTTLFRAAVNSGLKITERYAHAFPVAYYNPQGFDATIYPPHPDLRFINDTPHYILIQSEVKDSQITFEIFGTDDGRQVKIIGPQILEQKEDGSMKTILIQEIYQEGELIRQDKFYSHYKSPDLYPVERNPLE
jgi:vancomycin resistance protein YoaR